MMPWPWRRKTRRTLARIAIEGPILGSTRERVLKALLGGGTGLHSVLSRTQKLKALQSQESEMVVVAHDLSPADMLIFKEHKFAGFVTDVGGVTSHTAIMARSLSLPAIVDRGKVQTGCPRKPYQFFRLLAPDSTNY